MQRGVWILIIVLLGWSVWYNHASAPFLWAADPTVPTGNPLGGTTIVISEDADNFAYEEDLSGDGAVAVFRSAATNLVVGDTNGVDDIFVYERTTESITRVSVASDGTEGNALSQNAVISADGRYVAFTSAATNLAANDTNFVADGFIHDRTTGTTVLATIAHDGRAGNDSSGVSDISGDGRYVVFTSAATNLVPHDTNAVSDVFVRDTQLQTTTRVSVATDGSEGDDYSTGGLISNDGSRVLFNSRAGTLVAGEVAENDIFLHNRMTGETTRLLDSEQFEAFFTLKAISGNGAYVLLDSTATDLAAGDENNVADAFRIEIATGMVEIASLTSTGDFIYLGASGTSISHDGRYVVFSTEAPVVAPEDTNIFSDIFRRDMNTNAVEWVSQEVGDVRYEEVYGGIISGDGEAVLFSSIGGIFAPTQTNLHNVFLRMAITPPPLPTPTPAPYSLFTPAIASGSGLAHYPRLTNLTSHANGGSFAPVANRDGSVVAFLSEATNLVSNDTNGVIDAFVWQKQTNAIQRVSLSDMGTQANAETTFLRVSQDGRYLLFITTASNLVVGDNNGLADLYRHDLQTGKTEWVSVGLNGAAGDGMVTSADLSEDGRWIVFSSQAHNITAIPLPVTCPEAPCETLYRRDMQTEHTETWFVDSNGVAIAPLRNPSLSADGQSVAYERMVLVGYCTISTCCICIFPMPVYGPDLYLFKSENDTPVKFAGSRYEEQGDRYSWEDNPIHPVLAPDVTKVIYHYIEATEVHGYYISNSILTYHPNGDDDGRKLVGTTYPSSRDTLLQSEPLPPPPAPLTIYTLSGDGEIAVFSAADLRTFFPFTYTPEPEILDDANAREDIYWFDYEADRYVRVSDAPNGHLSNGNSRDPYLSANGRVVVFASEATNLSTNDTNGMTDIFVWETVR